MSTRDVFGFIVDLAACVAFGAALWKIGGTPGQGTIAFALTCLFIIIPIGARRR